MYAGDSRGHWEGDTLVVERSTSTEARFSWLAGTPPALAMTPTFKLMERFTRTAPDTITLTYTVDDPSTWTRPWTVEMPMNRNQRADARIRLQRKQPGIFSTLKNARLQEAGKIAPPAPNPRGDGRRLLRAA